MAAVSSRILLVDDEKDILLVFKLGLESKGFAVTAFNKPEEALEKCGPAEYDLALLDIKMPGMNGFELARALWKKNNSLQICFLTTSEIYESEAKKTLTNLKNFCFLKKPIPIEELARHIQTHLAKR